MIFWCKYNQHFTRRDPTSHIAYSCIIYHLLGLRLTVGYVSVVPTYHIYLIFNFQSGNRQKIMSYRTVRSLQHTNSNRCYFFTRLSETDWIQSLRASRIQITVTPKESADWFDVVNSTALTRNFVHDWHIIDFSQRFARSCLQLWHPHVTPTVCYRFALIRV